MSQLNIGIIFSDAFDHAAPQTAAFQHIGFVHVAEFVFTQLCGFKADSRNALNLFFIIQQCVKSRFTVFGLVSAAGTKVKSAGQLADNNHIDAIGNDTFR